MQLSRESYDLIVKLLQGKADIDYSALKDYLEKRKQVLNTAASVPASNIKGKTIQPASSVWRLSKENVSALEKFIEQLKLKVYSESTIRTYRNEFMQLPRPKKPLILPKLLSEK